MDLGKPIIYRRQNLNGVLLETGRVLRGIAVESADYSSVEGVGFTEKRAAADGLHASDVYLSGRRVRLGGHIYATNLAELSDYLHVLRAIFSPTSAYQEAPGDRGFVALEYSQPTLDEESFPGGVIPLYMNVRPLSLPSFAMVRDRLDATSIKPRPTALPWSAELLAKDPRVYVIAAPPPASRDQFRDVSGPANSGATFGAINRGVYETPMNFLLNIDAAPGTGKAFQLTGLNGIDMTVFFDNVPNVVYRWFGDDRVLMTQDVSGGVTTRALVLRMDLVHFATKNRRPAVPASISPPTRPFTSSCTYYSSAPLGANSRLFWSEAFA